MLLTVSSAHPRLPAVQARRVHARLQGVPLRCHAGAHSRQAGEEDSLGPRRRHLAGRHERAQQAAQRTHA